ncbi:MAG: Sec-independent protein translocase subunit TatA [Bdellovibrionales bacterium]
MGLSFWHIVVVLLVVLIVFGAGRLPQVMGDLGKGIRSFKDGMNSDNNEEKQADQSKQDAKPLPPSSTKKT